MAEGQEAQAMTKAEAEKEIARLREALECVKRNTETLHIESLRAAKANMYSAWLAADSALNRKP